MLIPRPPEQGPRQADELALPKAEPFSALVERMVESALQRGHKRAQPRALHGRMHISVAELVAGIEVESRCMGRRSF